MKIFWWQLSWDIIPTEANHEKHHVPILPSCKFCGFSKATSIHSIFECMFVRKIWRELAIVLPKGHSKEISVIDFLSMLFKMNPTMQKEPVLATAWGIWRKRCDFSYTNEDSLTSLKPLTLQSVRWAIILADEYKGFKSNLDKPRMENSLKTLKHFLASRQGSFLVFTDASFDPE